LPIEESIMSMISHGVVFGKNIALEESLGIPDGQEVEVVVKVLDPSKPWGEGIKSSAGVAADIPGVDEVFEEIQRCRKTAKFREPTP
jgi:hypothetical protein